jgi:uncharacterized repeat protein (TIGR01451 family)
MKRFAYQGAMVAQAVLGRRGAVALVVLALLAGARSATGQPVTTGRGFGSFYVSFQDVNGNGVIDCDEPVTIAVGYVDSASAPNAATGPISGTIVAPFAGTVGLSYINGSAAVDYGLSVDCFATVTSGNSSGDLTATWSFSCPNPPTSTPPRGNAITVTYRALYVGTSHSFSPVFHGTTSDGLDQTRSFTKFDQIGADCQGAPPSVTVTKTASGSGQPGSTILYQISATDTSGLGLGGAQMTDEIPANTVFDAGASDPAWACAGTTAGSLCRLQIGNIDRNGTVTRFFAVDIVSPLPRGVASVTNTACVRSGGSTVVGCGSVTTPTAGAPHLQMTKTLASGTGTPGATLVYNLAVSNTGNQDAGTVTLEETVPANTTFAAGPSSPGWSCSGTSAGSTCTLNLTSLAAGSSASATFAVTIAPTLPAGTTSIANTACADTTGSAESCSTVTTPTNGMPLLSLQKSAMGSGAPGSNEVYSLTLQNTGTQGTTDVTVTETVPSNTGYVAAGSSGWACSGTTAGSTCTITVASLAAGATVNLVFVVQIASPLPAGVTSIANTACASASGLHESLRHRPDHGSENTGRPSRRMVDSPPLMSCSSITTPTTGNPALMLTKSYSGGPVLPGAALTFFISLRNSGNQDAGPTVVTETVPQLSTFDAADSSPAWSCTAVTPGSTCTISLANVAAGAPPLTFIFAVKAANVLPPSAVIRNTACAQAGSGNRTCQSASTPPALSTDTLLTAVIDHALPAHSGDRIHYTLSIPNATASTLTALVANGALDSNTTLVAGSVTTDHGTVTTGNGPADTSVVVAVGNLPAGESATVRFDVTVNTPIPAGLAFVAAQFSTSGANIPTDPSDDPSTPTDDDPTETAVMSSVGPPPVQAIPTLGEWGLILLTMSLAGAGLVVQRRRQVPRLG